MSMKTKKKDNKKIRILFVFNSCKNRGPTRVILNIIKNLDFAKFEPILLTLSDETDESNLIEFLLYIKEHILCRISKAEILTNRLSRLKKAINDIAPDVIHTTGVFPDYAISKIFGYKQVVTLHNYAPIDYVAKFGKIRGRLLVKMQYYAVKKAMKTVACSESLTK
ncbi:glycosyltransferase, partial [Candidatus Saccharibacteria bacterium]|nr:glycosyltransferase [Candidatus Saccharibacteria bacterium]